MNVNTTLVENTENIKNSITHEGGIFYLDMKELAELSSEMCDEIYDDPEEMLERIGLEVFSIFGLNGEIRLTNVINDKEIKKLRSKDLRKLITVKGVIRRLTKVMPKIDLIKYSCPGCGTVITVLQGDKKLKKLPEHCSCGRTTGFKELSKEINDIQELNLESLPEISNGQPQQLRVLLEKELVDVTLISTLQPGKRIEVTGILQEMPGFMTTRSDESILSEFMIKGNNIKSLEESSEVVLSDDDIAEIKDILHDDPLQFLADNIAPEIHGNDEIKKALVLQMVKGVNKKKSDGSLSRGDIHILLAGDPGVAKSVLSKFAEKKSPGSKTIIGTRTTKASIGAMAVKDELTNSWALEIGPLVQCNNSVLYFDEIDKMTKENLNELLEPMSSSCVTVNKAGISATLPAATSLCASANPKRGNYDLSQPLARQIDIPSPILNRFDLVFVMVDKPDADTDAASISHVFDSYITERVPDVNIDMYRKIISYCRKLKPKLKPSLIKHIKPIYINLRNRANREGSGAIPINLRNIEALIRLSEAHAKLRLSEWVEEEDFIVAKDLFMYCLKQVGIEDETGMIDMSRSTEKIPTSHRGRIDKILGIVRDLSDIYEEGIKEKEIYDIAKAYNIEKYEATTFLNELKRNGDIIEKTRGVWKLL